MQVRARAFLLLHCNIFLSNFLKPFITAKTLISNKICNKLPTKEHLDKIIEGAKQHELPKDYIEKIEKQPIKKH